jgi:hypothetical protein
MNYRVILLATLEICFSFARANDIWIHAVGIDSDKSQNSATFYESADSFLKACKNSSRKPECHLLINDSPQLRSFLDSSLVLAPNEGPASKAKTLSLLEDAIRKIKPPGQIILSLDDHGAPDRSENGHACMYFGSDDKLCDNELADLLQQAPKGVRIFVNADGCYSGPFANVVKYGACARTGADQIHYGSGGFQSMWMTVNESQANRLIRHKVPAEAGTVPRFSSQLIMRSLCKNSRVNFQVDEKTKMAFLALGQMRMIRDVRCSGDRMEIHNRSMSAGFDSITQSLSKYSCEQLSLPEPACAAKNRLKNLSAKDKKKFVDLDNLFSHFLEAKKRAETFIAESTKGIDRQIAIPVDVILDREKNGPADTIESFRSYPPEKLKEIKRIVDELRPTQERIEKDLKEAMVRMKDALHEVQSLGAYQDWLDVHSCLSSEEFDDRVVGYSQGGSSDGWDTIARNSPPLKFTIEDYRAARACESEIRF